MYIYIKVLFYLLRVCCTYMSSNFYWWVYIISTNICQEGIVILPKTADFHHWAQIRNFEINSWNGRSISLWNLFSKIGYMNCNEILYLIFLMVGYALVTKDLLLNNCTIWCVSLTVFTIFLVFERLFTRFKINKYK